MKHNGPAPWWFGGIFLVTGAVIMLVGMEVIPVDPSSVHAPMWVITMAGGVFFMGGVMALTQGVISDSANNVLAAIFVTMLAAMFSWVAFGPGERQFSSTVSVGPVSTSSRGNGGMGRIMFGFGAILMWVMVLGITFKVAKGWLGVGSESNSGKRGPGKRGSRKHRPWKRGGGEQGSGTYVLRRRRSRGSTKNSGQSDDDDSDERYGDRS